MKAMTENNRSSRVLTAVMILTMTAAVGYGQGLLAEGAAKLFNALTSKNKSEQTIFHNVAYSGQADWNAEREFSPEVLRSFNVEAVEITFEQEVKSEEWMTESFTDNVEAGVTVEAWMNELFADNVETEVAVEEWMTAPISESLEMPVSVEDWMTTPMTQNLESPVTVEDWMTTPMSQNLETNPATEEWMTTPLYTEVETAPEVESWMTTPLFTKATGEEKIQLEDWMTASLW